MTTFVALCSDFYVNQKLALKMDLPSERETILHFFDRVRKVADVAGYATTEEFIQHVLEKEMLHFEDAGSDDDIRERLKGLGYIS